MLYFFRRSGDLCVIAGSQSFAMCRSPSWLLMSWCLTSGLNLYASAAPLPVPDLDRVNDVRSLVADRDFWTERCAQNPDSSIGSKIRPLEVICGYLRRARSNPIKSSEKEMSLYRILRSGILRRRNEDSSDDDRSQSKRQGDIVGKLLQKDGFVEEALGEDAPRSKAWNGEAGYNQDVWSPIPIAEVPVASDDSVDKRSDGSRESPSSGSDLERFLESKRGDKMTPVHGGQGTGHPRWSVYFIG